MQDVLVFILKNITTAPDDVVVDAKDEGGVTNYTIAVNPDDVGRVIGKEGKVIKAIRTIMRVIAIQKGVRIRVSVLSDSDEGEGEVAAAPQEDTVTIEDAAPEDSTVAQSEPVQPTEPAEPTESAEPTVEPQSEEPDSLTVEV
jgi:hypothetical protein